MTSTTPPNMPTARRMVEAAKLDPEKLTRQPYAKGGKNRPYFYDGTWLGSSPSEIQVKLAAIKAAQDQTDRYCLIYDKGQMTIFTLLDGRLSISSFDGPTIELSLSDEDCQGLAELFGGND